MNHSPEPWYCSYGASWIGLETDDHDRKAWIVFHRDDESNPRSPGPIICEMIEPSQSPQDENARRIVAAVNFCQHLPTEFLENHSAHLCDGFGSLTDIPGFYGLIPVSSKPRVPVP